MNGYRISIAWILLISASTFAMPPIPSFTGIGDLPGGVVASGANAGSADGSVVTGTSEVNNAGKAFSWTWEEGLIQLPDGVCQTNFTTTGVGISGDGALIVGTNLGLEGHAAAWTRWGPVDLGAIGCQYMIGEGRDASYDGSVIVGTAGIPQIGSFPCRWTMDGIELLTENIEGGNGGVNAVSDDGRVVAGSLAAGSFIWREGIGAEVIFPSSGFRGLSADGTVAVGNRSLGPPDFTTRTIRWTEQCIDQDFYSPGSPSDARVVSQNGVVILGSGPNGIWIWDPINGGRNFRTYLDTELGISNLIGWQLLEVNDISNDGAVVVGDGRRGSDPEGWVAYIPPVTILRGDTNYDGAIDNADVPAFVDTLLAPCDAPIRDRYAADMDDDRFVDGHDLSIFVDVLIAN